MSTHRRAGAVVLVVLLVAGAGCSSFAGSQETAQPTGTDAQQPTGTDAQQPTGTDAQQPTGTDADSARVRADIVGLTAEGVAVEPSQTGRTQAAIANRLGVEPSDVTIRTARETPRNGTVELFDDSVTREEFRTALEAAGYEPSTVRTGVTDATRDELTAVVSERLRLAGIESETVSVEASGQQLTVTVPERNASAAREALNDRGSVRVYAVSRTDAGNWTRERVLAQDEFADVGTAQTSVNQPQVPVVIEQDAAERFQEAMVAAGFDDGAVCDTNVSAHDTVESVESTCLVVTLNGEPVFLGGVEPSLGQSFADGSFADDPAFVMTTTTMAEARELERSLKAGRLPAPLVVEDEG